MSIRYTAEQLQRKFPGSAASPGYARVADAMRAEGRLDEAIGLCREGLRARPLVAGYVVLGKSLMDAGRLEEAREQFESALRLDPRCLSAMRSLALIMDKLQWGEAAVGYYRSILQVEPWDAEIRALLEGAASAGPGSVPAGSASADATQHASAGEEDTFAKPEGLQGDVMEVNLNDVADEFLPSGNDVPDMASLEDSLPSASGTTHFPAGDFSPAPDADADAEPRPMDVLSSSQGPETLGENAPAPISGSDVEERLDSLFGNEDGGQPSATATWTAAAPRPDAPPEASATATGEMRSMDALSEFPSEVAPFDLADAPSVAEASASDPGIPGDLVSDAPTAAPSGPDLEDGDVRVQGEDIERRLDELFNLTGEDDAPKPSAEAQKYPSALSASDLPVVSGPKMGETVILGEAVAFGDRPAAVPAEPESQAPSGEIVTGQDVADKLESLLGPDPQGKRDEETPAIGASPTEAATAFGTDVATDAANPMGPFADLLQPLSDAQAQTEPAPPSEGETILSTETMQPSAWQVDAPQVTGADVEAQLDKLFNLEPDAHPAPGQEAPAGTTAQATGNLSDTVSFMEPAAGEKANLRESVADWLARREDAPAAGESAPFAGAGDTLILPNEDVFPASEAETAGNVGPFDTLAPEDPPALSGTSPIEMVDGGDVAERLDKLFSEPPAVPSPEEPGFEIDLAEIPDPLPEPDATMEVPIPKVEGAEPEAEDEDASSLSLTGNGPATTDHDVPAADARWAGTPADAAASGSHAASSELSPMLDEEEGYPADEEMPAQAAGANVATVTLAEIYFQQGLKEQALQIYRQLLEREPENESVRKRIAEIEASKAEGDRGPESDPRWPRPGLKVPKRKK